MIDNRSLPSATVIPELAYEDVGKASDWLCAVFGFTERLRIANHRVQLTFGDGAVIAIQGGSWSESAPLNTHSSHSLLVRVEDANSHHERAVRLGAHIVNPPADYAFGERQYTAEDPGGHRWTFSQSLDDIDPESWGARLPDNG